MWSFKDHGKAFDRVFSDDDSPGFRWLHESFGSNYRMLEIQAAIGRIQLRRFADWHQRRVTNAMAIARALLEFPGAVRVPMPCQGFEHAFYRLYAYVRPEGLSDGWNRNAIIVALKERGVPVFQGSCPEVYLEKAFDGTPFQPTSRLPVARELGETSLSFLTHPTMTGKDIEHTLDEIRSVFAEASR
jgi:dTDP-4-amino-4,6-dideoxygalactose transaminase